MRSSSILLVAAALGGARRRSGVSVRADGRDPFPRLRRPGQRSLVRRDAHRGTGREPPLARREDGSWAGDLAQDDDLVGGETKLSGPNVNTTFKQKGGKTEVEGLFYGERVRLSVDTEEDQGPLRLGARSISRKGPPIYRGDVGCM